MMIYRKDEILHRCKGKNVLHLGFVQHSDQYERKIMENDWLHDKIAKIAKKTIGIDYLKNTIDDIKLKYPQYKNLFFADVTNESDMEYVKSQIGGTKIDVIVCGELIGHVDNVGKMMSNIKMFMNTNTILIITTPNPFSYERIKLVLNKHYDSEWLNFELINWYSYQSLRQLLDRMDFTEVNYTFYYGETKNVSPLWKRIIKKAVPFKRWHYPIQLYDGLFFVAKIKGGE